MPHHRRSNKDVIFNCVIVKRRAFAKARGAGTRRRKVMCNKKGAVVVVVIVIVTAFIEVIRDRLRRRRRASIHRCECADAESADADAALARARQEGDEEGNPSIQRAEETEQQEDQVSMPWLTPELTL